QRPRETGAMGEQNELVSVELCERSGIVIGGELDVRTAPLVVESRRSWRAATGIESTCAMSRSSPRRCSSVAVASTLPTVSTSRRGERTSGENLEAHRYLRHTRRRGPFRERH